MNEISDKANSMLEEIQQKFDFLNEYSGNNINDDLARAIKNDIDVLDSTSEIEFIKNRLKTKCIDNQLLKCDQNTLQKSICTNIAYTFFSIEKYRDITLTRLINLLQATNLKGLNVGYLVVQTRRKNNMREWISANFIMNNEIACPVFKTRSYYWEKQDHLQYVLNYFNTYCK